MRILLVTARYYPESFSITKFAEKLVLYGHDVTVLTGKPWFGKYKIYDGYKNVKSETINGVRVIRINEIPRRKFFGSLLINYISILFGFKKALKKLEGTFDIVLSHVMSPIFSINYVGKYCKRNNIPNFLYLFDLWPESLVATDFCNRKSIILKIMEKYCIRIYNDTDFISFASPSCTTYFNDYLKVNKPMDVIYQPCLSSFPNDELVDNHLYKRDGKIHLLYCGSLSRFTHLDLIVKAVGSGDFENKIVFDVVGDGYFMKKISKEIQREKIANIKLHGYVTPSQTAEFYRNCDVIFVPLFNNSYTSAMIPQKINESLMYKRPIFGMLCGDGRDILKKSSSLNIISEQTVEDLKTNLRALIKQDVSELERCGLENRHYFLVSEEFRFENQCRKLEKLLKTTIQEFLGKK